MKRSYTGRRATGVRMVGSRQRSRAMHTAAWSQTATVQNQATASKIQVDLNQYFSTMLGRNLPQSQTYRVTGLRCRQYWTAGQDTTRLGFANDVTWTWISPTAARVSAWEAIRDEFAAEVVENREWARGRQLIVGYATTDAALPIGGSLLDRAGTLATPCLIGAGSATKIAIFDEYNQAHPKMGDPGTIGGQPSQELFSVYASEIEDAIRMGCGKGYARGSYVERYAGPLTLTAGTDQPVIFGNVTYPVFDEQGQWQAERGHHLAVMCGLMTITIAPPWPFKAPPAQSDGGGFVSANHQQDTTMTIVCEADVEGWEPFVKKGV